MKKEDLNKKVLRHFWIQKRNEIGIVLFFLFTVLSVLGLIAQIGWGCKNIDRNCDLDCECKVPYEPQLPIWIMITGIITTGIWILVGFIAWIRCNWREAKYRAENKIRPEKFKKVLNEIVCGGYN